MLLTIDVGNTNICMGILQKNKVIGSFRLTTQTPRTSDEFGICIRSLMEQSKITAQDVEDVVISSVVPKRMYALTSCIKKYLNKEPIIITCESKTPITLQVDNPKEVGADRIVDAVGAYEHYKRSCIVIDFGTATTIDYISDKGVFKYAITAPGVGIIAQALTGETAKLPEIEIKKPESILATNTVLSMQAGIVYGYIGLVEGIVKRLKEELKEDCPVIATGGLGRMIADETKCIDDYDSDLAYQGMYLIYQCNQKGKLA